MTTQSDGWCFFSTCAGDVERSFPTAVPGCSIRDDAAPLYRLHNSFVAGLSGQRSGCTGLGCYFECTCDRRPLATALECEGERGSHADPDQRANRLMARGARAGVRVGVPPHRPLSTHVALLAVTNTKAAFVPIDPEAPADRLQYIADSKSGRAGFVCGHGFIGDIP
jgi:non-ribosomal peptide synthetase component F